MVAIGYAYWSDALQLRWPPVLFAGVSSSESDGPRTGAYDREGRKHHSLHRSGGNTPIREHCSEMDLLLPGTLTDPQLLEHA